MADLYFSRGVTVYLQQGTNVWQIPVLAGYSFSQSTNTSEISLNEMTDTSGNSRRGKQVFTDSLSPAEWSFDMYMRPYMGTADGQVDGTTPLTHCVEEAIWANFVSVGDFTPGETTTAADWDSIGVVLANQATGSSFNFTASNKAALGTFTLYFVFDGAVVSSVYKIEGCVVGGIGVTFDLEGIATLNVSGSGGVVQDITEGTDGLDNAPTATITEGIADTDNFIRNRLTSLAVQSVNDSVYGLSAGWTLFPGSGSGAYTIVITGGSINFENNISFLTPETLGIVNTPLEHVTGGRSVSGNFTCYLARDATGGSAADFINDLNKDTTRSLVSNQFALTFSVGGSADPKVVIAMPKCHVSVPNITIEDVISMDVAFSALPTDLSSADEATITYHAPA